MMRHRVVRYLPSMFVALAIGMFWMHGPVQQPAQYHAFADQSSAFGMLHASDVLSNLPFLLVALWGLYRLLPLRAHPAMRESWPAYLLFLCALALTASGSCYYHLAPDNARLLWDRLPIAMACAGLLAAVRAEHVPNANGCRDALLLCVLAMASVLWWYVTDLRTDLQTDLHAAGDLRPYLLFQALPLVLIPLWQIIYKADRKDRRAFGMAMVLYILAKGAELYDHELLGILNVASGHTIKHVLAGTAAAVIVSRLIARCESGNML
jgi:hypothetical protein